MDESREGIIPSYPEISDAELESLPPVEVRQEILEMILPGPDVLAKIRDAFGDDSPVYRDLHDLSYGETLSVRDDLYEFREWLNLRSWVLWPLPSRHGTPRTSPHNEE